MSDGKKTFLSSKLNWLGILTAAAGLADLLGTFPIPIPDKAKAAILAVSGVATVILRTFFTSKPVEPAKP